MLPSLPVEWLTADVLLRAISRSLGTRLISRQHLEPLVVLGGLQKVCFPAPADPFSRSTLGADQCYWRIADPARLVELVSEYALLKGHSANDDPCLLRCG